MSEVLLDNNFPPEVDNNFVIDNDGKADWALRQIIAARAERDRLIKHFKAQIDKAEDNCSRQEEHWRAHLLPYMDQVPLHRTRTQSSYALPSGVLRIKQQAPELQHDDRQLLEWLDQNGLTQLIRVKTSREPAWSDVKKAIVITNDVITLKETGEEIPGIKVVHRDPKFEIEVTV